MCPELSIFGSEYFFQLPQFSNLVKFLAQEKGFSTSSASLSLAPTFTSITGISKSTYFGDSKIKRGVQGLTAIEKLFSQELKIG